MFTGFLRLPAEIQDMIWFRALPPARNIQIKGRPAWGYQSQIPPLTQHYSNDVIPVVLHVCSKSRALAMLTYKLASYYPHSSRVLWINFDKDIVVLSNLSRFKLLSSGAPHLRIGVVWMVDHLKYLVLASRLMYGPACHVRNFMNLEKVIFCEANTRSNLSVPQSQAAHGSTSITGVLVKDISGITAKIAAIKQAFSKDINSPAEKFLLQEMEKNARNLNIDNFELPEVKYMSEAEFDEKYQTPRATSLFNSYI